MSIFNNLKKKPYKNIQNPNLRQVIHSIGNEPVDTVLIETSTTCKVCSTFNQRIFSIYGRDRRFPQLHAFLFSPMCNSCGKAIQYYRYCPGINGKLDEDIAFSNRPFTSPDKQIEVSTTPAPTVLTTKQSEHTNIYAAETKSSSKDNSKIGFPDWYISVSFGKSSSSNYAKAVALAKQAPQYHEQTDDGVLLHQAIYSDDPDDFKAYLMLYETVNSWKSTFVMINGKLIDRKVIGKINYCYGDKCRIGNDKFCYGASYMTDNPFGCHRLQISAMNNPWWSFYHKSGNEWYLDKAAIKERIDSYASIYYLCPCFDYEKILSVYNTLPATLSNAQYSKVCDSNFFVSETSTPPNRHTQAYTGFAAPTSPKSRLVTLLLCVTLGYFGVHRFYVGKTGSGLLWLFTMGLFGIGYIVDIIMIALGSFRDSNGLYVKNS